MSVTTENLFGDVEVTLRRGSTAGAVYASVVVMGDDDPYEHILLGEFRVRDLLAAVLAFTPKQAPRRRFLSLRRSKHA